MKLKINFRTSSLLIIAERLNNWSRWRTLPQEFIKSFKYSQFLDKCKTDLEHILSKPIVRCTLLFS